MEFSLESHPAFLKDINNFNNYLKEMSNYEYCFLPYYSYLEKNKISHPFSKSDVIRAISSRKSVKQDYSIVDGLTLLGYGIKSNKPAFENDIYEKLITDVNDRLINYIKSNLRKKSMLNYELLYGIIGPSTLLLDYSDRDEARIIITEVVRECIMLLKFNDDYPNFMTTINETNSLDIKKFPNGHIRFGVAHGMSGIIGFLSLCYKYGFLNNEIKSILSDSTKFLLDWRFQDNRYGTLWPAKLSVTDYKNKRKTIDNMYPMSWCYGSAGIFNCLLNSSYYTSDKHTLQWAESSFLSSLKKTDLYEMFTSPIVCHGYGGLLLILKNFYFKTDNKEFLFYIDKILTIIFSFRTNDNYNGLIFKNFEFSDDEGKLVFSKTINSYISGQYSIFLSLLSFLDSNKEDFMSRCLLIN